MSDNDKDLTEPPDDYSQSDTIECPMCGARQTVRGKAFTTENSVIAHIAGSTNGSHAGVSYQQAKRLVESGKQPAREADAKGDSGSSNESGSNSVGGEGIPDPPNAESGKSRASAPCCNSPDLRSVPVGRSFTAKSGQTGTTETGDRVCESCDALVESDGTVVR